MEPRITPARAYGLPPNFSGDFLIWERATRPRIKATKPGIGPKQPASRIPAMPVIIDAIASPSVRRVPGTYGKGAGGGGGAHGPGLIGGRSSGAIQPPASGGSRGSH